MHYSPGLYLKPNMKVVVSITVWVILGLVSLRTFWKMPIPLFVFINFSFLFVSVIFWTVKINCKKIGAVQITQLVLLWVFSTSLFLFSVFNIDKAGWLWFKLTGYNLTLSENYVSLIKLSPEEFVNRFQIFSLDPQNPTKLILRKGKYVIDETIVIPENTSLTIESGTVLNFDVGCSLISYSPIYAQGTASAPIRFLAKNKLLKWGVVGIVGAEKSIFEYVTFKHGRQARVNNIDFLAGLSIIESDVEITNSRFVNMFGKDAMYVRLGTVTINNNIFKNTYKDGLDLDGGSGEIYENEFINCGDESIDLSENINIRVFKNTILDKRGGRISADINLKKIKSLNTLGFFKKS